MPAMARSTARKRRFVASGRCLAFVIAAIALVPVAGCGGCGSRGPAARQRRTPERLELSVVGVHDGDTLTGLSGGREQVKVRIEGIDAPELGQPFGRVAKRELSGRVFGKKVSVVTSGRDRYDRVVGRVLLGDRDVGAEMVREGFAWHAVTFSRDRQLAAAEEAARRARAGLWADASPEPPWKFRARRAKEPADADQRQPGGWFRWWFGQKGGSHLFGRASFQRAEQVPSTGIEPVTFSSGG